MNKKVICLLLLACVVDIMAQTQKGIVRTAQRPNKKVEYLEGVTIRRSGDVNAMVSGAGGKFEILLPGMKVGDAFSLSRVVKKDYELADNGTIGKAFAYSPKVQVEIVMLNSKEKQDDIRRISDNAYRRAENTYKQRTASLEQQLKEKTISEESYRKQLQELQHWFEKYEALISDMAERYASTDYATIDSLNAAINICIENGELERADSLISTAGSLDRLVKESLEVKGNAHEKIRIGQEIIAEGASQLAKVRDNDKRLGDLLYSKYSICLARAENDSAMHYITMRAELDTANVEWQFDAGSFIFEYFAKHNEAMSYYQRALRNAKQQFGENSEWVIRCFNAIGMNYYGLANDDKALESFTKAMEIGESIYGENHTEIAMSYYGIGMIYDHQGNNEKALDLYAKAQNIWESVGGENYPDMALSYNNMGVIYSNQGKYAKALEMYTKALNVWKNTYGKNYSAIALSYNNIGSIYSDQDEEAKALEMFEKALVIWKSAYGENHPNLALSYNEMGVIYLNQGKYTEALEKLTKALDIRKSVYGENHPDVAITYCNKGSVYYLQGNYIKMFESYEKALKIWRMSIYKKKFSKCSPFNEVDIRIIC